MYNKASCDKHAMEVHESWEYARPTIDLCKTWNGWLWWNYAKFEMVDQKWSINYYFTFSDVTILIYNISKVRLVVY